MKASIDARTNPRHAISTLLVTGMLLLILPSCSGGDGQSGTIIIDPPGPFQVLNVQPDGKEPVFLNQILVWNLSRRLDIDSVNFNSIAFEVFDPKGNPLSEQVSGGFRLGLDADGVPDPRVLEFEPRMPTNKTFDDGGFKPSRIYKVTLALENNGNKSFLRDMDGNALSQGSPFLVLDFRTVSGSTAKELFRDNKKGGPGVRLFSVEPRTGNRVALNLLGTLPVEIRLSFDQPLNPSKDNVPFAQDRNPVNAASREKGRIFLEYDDPVLGNNRWIRARIEMSVNDSRGALVLIRPEGVLPNHATVRVIVEPELQDLSSESNVKEPTYVRVVGSFMTQEAYGPQFDALMIGFENADLLDKDAPFLDPVAEIKDGLLRASFDFEGKPTTDDWVPTSRELNLNTNFAVVQPRNGPTRSVSGGVFHFRDIEIKDKVRIRGYGSNPLVFLANGTVRIDGQVVVDGPDGESPQRGPVYRPTRPVNGGPGHCGGASGGRASQDGNFGTLKAESGWGAGQVEGGGGEGGRAVCGNSTAANGSGGGGGSMAIQGDPSFNSAAIQKSGRGGDGSSALLPGGKAGATLFPDSIDTNDFWGRLVTDKGQVIVGELQTPMGGAGGGGGGDQIAAVGCETKLYLGHRRGGGGGAGGGVLIIKALGPIIVGTTGRLSADGGQGGAGEYAAPSLSAGGGGGGSGGMIVLMSNARIELHTHQGTYANNDYNFSVTADGSISRTHLRLNKYPPGADMNNSGGYGGMGLIQLQVPPGTDADNTGTILDDNIRIIQGANVLSGASKTAYLFNGDLRPNPRLLPVTYGRFSTAEFQWQSTGASVRRESNTPATAGARVLDSRLGKSGPQWFFQGLVNKSTTGANGYLESGLHGAGMGTVVVLPGSVTRVGVLNAESRGADYHGSPAHVIHLSKGALPDPLKGGWSYANYRARLFDKSDQVLADHQILSTSADGLLLDAGLTTLPVGVASLEIVAKFLRVEMNGQENLGEYYARREGKYLVYYPKANIQIGFAFHKDPSAPNFSGSKDLNRFPEEAETFLYSLDLDDPATMEQLRQRHYPFAKIRVRFNLNYTPDHPDTKPGPHPIHAGMDLPGLRYLILPYRF